MIISETLKELVANRMYAVRVPFQELYTTVYVFISEGKAAIIDSATYPSDIDNYVLPALGALGIKNEEVKYLLLTHSHSDHIGGFARLRELFPSAIPAAPFGLMDCGKSVVVSDKDVIGGLCVVSLPGHTENSVGYLDTESKALMSGDCIQLAGVGKYTKGVTLYDEYIASMDKLLSMDIDMIAAAHDYVPLGSTANGKKEVREYICLAKKLAKGCTRG